MVVFALIFLYPSNFEVGGGMQESYFYFSVHGISSLMDLIHFKQWQFDVLKLITWLHI